MKRLLFYFVLPIAFLLLTSGSIWSVSLEDCEKEDISQDKLGECIDILSKKVTDLSAQKRTLSSQIAQFDNQIRLTQLKIAEAEAIIAQLEKEIGILGFRIGYITESVDRLEKLLKQRIVATYQQSFISNLELLLTSRDFSDLILRVQYLKQVQENDKRILANLQQTKANYANQKDERETKQAAIEENKNKLLGLKTSLDQQKTEKQAFLEITKNDESYYQKLLSQALAESKAITAAFSEAVRRLNNGEGDNVSQGATIAQIGNSGAPDCSTGAHLHFTVLKNGSHQNPSNYLSSTSFSYSYGEGDYIKYGTIDGPSGNWPWPIDQPIIINQAYGSSHLYAKNYNPPVHDGIDMQSGQSPANGRPIKAPKSGKIIRGSTICDSSYVPGVSTLKYAAIKHEDDPSIITIYLHIQ